MKRIVPLLLAAALLLCGCGTTDEGPELGSQVWEIPQLIYGVMECEKLEVLPWDSGRCEATAYETMAETKHGYYLVGIGGLLYADKANLCNWVPVCNKPNCSHSSMSNWSRGQVVCNSEMQDLHFFIRDGRIWFLWMPKGAGYDDWGSDSVVMSMNPDGTDRRVEYQIRSGAATPMMGMFSFSSREIIYNELVIETDGRCTGHSYRVTDGGLVEIAFADNLDENERGVGSILTGFQKNMYGDPVLFNTIETGSLTGFTQVLGDRETVFELGDIPVAGAYLSGDILRFFRQNDGYYDRNIRTGQETRLADCQLENSYAAVVLPNCILESTLLERDSLGSRTSGQTHCLRLFDGESWQNVALPSELKVSDTAFVEIKSVSSDCVLFFVRENIGGEKYGYLQSDTFLYRLDLTQEELALAYVARFEGYLH